LSDYPGDGWGEIRWFLKVFVLSVALQNTIAVLLSVGADTPEPTDGWPMMLLSDSVDRWRRCSSIRMPMGDCWPLPSRLFFLADDRERPLMAAGCGVACLLSLSIGLFLSVFPIRWLGWRFVVDVWHRAESTLAAGPADHGRVASRPLPSAWARWLRGMVTVSSRQNTMTNE